jgi:Na+/proline symporter
MQNTILDTTGLVAIGLYLASLLVIGWWAGRVRAEKSLKDYYLAGSGLGTVSIFFTLYATQYSGNTLFAVPGKAYRQGLIGLSVVLAVICIVLVYFTFAPKLNRLAKENSFVSIGDFIKWRFDHKPLLIAVNLIAVFTLISYALGNFKAVGLLLESASGGTISFMWGIIILAGMMAIYETLGGLRAVIWTDILQGSLLAVGCLLLFGIVVMMNGENSITNPSVFVEKVGIYARDQVNIIEFVSTGLLIAVGAAVYPQAIQRMYIAKDADTLKKSYTPLLLMPILTTLPMILVGISVAEWMPNLEKHQSENVIIYAIGHITGSFPSLSWLLILYLGAAIAAIMSTIDSALLSLGSIITKDIIKGDDRSLSDKQLFRICKTTSWVLMMLIAVLAIVLPQTIWAMMIFKFELLIQMAPAFILGVRRENLNGRAVFAGLAAGCAVAVVQKLAFDSAPLGIHPGIWGLAANLSLMAILHQIEKGRSRMTTA